MLVCPDDVAKSLQTRPLLNSGMGLWTGVVLHRYIQMDSEVELPPLRDNVLVHRLAGHAHVEERRDGVIHDRRWTDPGQIHFTPSGWPMSRTVRGKSDILMIHIEQKLIDDVAHAVFGDNAKRAFIRPVFAEHDPRIDGLCKLLFDEARCQQPGNAEAAHSLARLIVLRLLRSRSNLSAEAFERVQPIPGAAIFRTVAYMRSHFGESLSLAQLAEMSGLGTTRFSSVFKDATGQSPHRFLTQLRMSHAQLLLSRAQPSILEIANRCGFDQPTNFSAAFRNHFGMSPRKMRELYRAQRGHGSDALSVEVSAEAQ